MGNLSKAVKSQLRTQINPRKMNRYFNWITAFSQLKTARFFLGSQYCPCVSNKLKSGNISEHDNVILSSLFHTRVVTQPTAYPKKYAHGFAVLCFVVVMQSIIMNSHEVFIHIHQGCFAGTGAIVRLPQCQWSKPDGYGKISQCITHQSTAKQKPCAYFLGYTEPILHTPRHPHINTGIFTDLELAKTHHTLPSMTFGVSIRVRNNNENISRLECNSYSAKLTSETTSRMDGSHSRSRCKSIYMFK